MDSKQYTVNSTILQKHNQESKMTDSKECKIIDSIDITNPNNIIQTPCGKFLIGIEKHSIFRCNLETKQKVRIAGSVDQPGHKDGTRDESRFDCPKGLTLSKDLKTLFVADTWNRVIRAICVGTGVTTTFAGQVRRNEHVDGQKKDTCFQCLKVLKLSPDGNTLYIADSNKLRTICIETGQVKTIGTFVKQLWDFSLSPDNKHIYICFRFGVSKYNLETWEFEIILESRGCFGCELSKYGQILFISNAWDNNIQVVNIVTNQVIDTINTLFEPYKLNISTNGKQLYIVDYNNDKIKVLDIFNYCTNFKTFLQSQFFKYSFLPRQVIQFN
jgi:hypothetical protein